MEHITKHQLYQIIDGSLSEPQRKKYLDHIEACKVCSENFASIIQFEKQMNSFLEIEREKCPDPIDIWKFEQGILDPEKAEAVRQHLSYCSICALEKEQASEVLEILETEESLQRHKVERIDTNNTRNLKLLTLAAEDSEYNEQVKSRLMHEFANKAFSIDVYSGSLLYADTTSASLVFRKGKTITTELDSYEVDLYIDGKLKRTLQIKNGSIIVDFDELEILIQDYEKIVYVIRKGDQVIGEGSLE